MVIEDDGYNIRRLQNGWSGAEVHSHWNGGMAQVAEVTTRLYGSAPPIPQKAHNPPRRQYLEERYSFGNEWLERRETSRIVSPDLDVELD